MNAKKTNRAKLNNIRIIGGSWRGRKLPVVDVEGLRPTGDRIRETLFNWLAPCISGSHCLDLFAGSGGLSFEALSRGADSVVAVDDSLVVVNSLKHTAKDLAATNLTVIKADALRWLAITSAPVTKFDLVFLDPPFHLDILGPIVKLLTENPWLAPKAMIYVEQPKGQEIPANFIGWQIAKEKTTGAVSYRLFQLRA